MSTRPHTRSRPIYRYDKKAYGAQTQHQDLFIVPDSSIHYLSISVARKDKTPFDPREQPMLQTPELCLHLEKFGRQVSYSSHFSQSFSLAANPRGFYVKKDVLIREGVEHDTRSDRDCDGSQK